MPSSRQRLHLPFTTNSRVLALPECKTDPWIWIQATDAVAKRRFDCSLPLGPDSTRDQPKSFFELLLNPEVLQEIQQARRIACVAHGGLSACVAQKQKEGFEHAWLALGAQAQLKHFMTAFEKLEEKANLTGMQDMKLNTPELCYDQLSRDGGQGFLDLLSVFLLPPNIVEPSQPFVLENARFDAFIGFKADDKSLHRKVWLEFRRITRTRYISGFLAIVLRLAEKREVNIVTYTPEHHKTKDKLVDIPAASRLDLILSPSQVDQWKKDVVRCRRKEMKLFCDACLKPENKAANGKMSTCGPCHAIGRDVRYCDKACQTRAWKMHKSECGKPLDLDSVLDESAPAPRRRPDIPPVPREISTALRRQIERLDEEPATDYFLALSEDPGMDAQYRGITLPDAPRAAAFLLMRGHAMAGTGAHAVMALRFVYQVLREYAPSAVALREQLRHEFGATFAEVEEALVRGKPFKLKETGREAVDDALESLRRVGRFEKEVPRGIPESRRIAVKAGSGGEQLWMQFPATS